MSQELKNSSGDVREIVFETSGEREMGGKIAMTCSDGDYKEGPNDDKYYFGAIDLSQDGIKVGSMSAAVNERGIIRFEGTAPEGSLDLTIDVTNLDSEGMGKISGLVGGQIIEGKIDPNNPVAGERDMERLWGINVKKWVKKAAGFAIKTGATAVGTYYGGPAGGMIGSKVGSWVANRYDLREFGAEVKFEANRGFMDIVKDPKKLLTTVLNVGSKWWNSNVDPDSPIAKLGNATCGVLWDKIKKLTQ